MTPFHSEMFPDCLVMSSESGFRIGNVDDRMIQKLHISSYPLGEAPSRLSHSPQGTRLPIIIYTILHALPHTTVVYHLNVIALSQLSHSPQGTTAK